MVNTGLQIQFNWVMKVRGDKSKDYYMDSKQITAKKGKKTHDSYTPNSLSTSHNHHKYQKYDQALQQQNQKQNISLKQFQSVLRSLQFYCKQNNQPLTHSKQKQLTARLYYYLCEKYRVIGDHQQIEKVKSQIEELIPQKTRICERCFGSGSKCNQAHIHYLNEVLPDDIETLRKQLQQLQLQNQLFLHIIKSRKSNKNQENTVEKLKSIIQNQQKILKQMQSREYVAIHRKNKSKLQIFIQQDDA